MASVYLHPTLLFWGIHRTFLPWLPALFHSSPWCSIYLHKSLWNEHWCSYHSLLWFKEAGNLLQIFNERPYRAVKCHLLGTTQPLQSRTPSNCGWVQQACPRMGPSAAVHGWEESLEDPSSHRWTVAYWYKQKEGESSPALCDPMRMWWRIPIQWPRRWNWLY